MYYQFDFNSFFSSTHKQCVAANYACIQLTCMEGGGGIFLQIGPILATDNQI